MKKLISILLTALLLCSLAVSAGAIIPFAGASVLTVTQDGAPAAGIALNLYRVCENNDGGHDTLIGTYVTKADGTVTASHLTKGMYCWQDASGNIGETFYAVGGRIVRKAVELPSAITNVTKTVSIDAAEYGVSGDITISVDVTGGWTAEINDYGTLYLYEPADGKTLLCIGFTATQERFDEDNELMADLKIEAPEGVAAAFYDDDEYGGTYCLIRIADGVYYWLGLDHGMDLEDVVGRLTITTISLHISSEKKCLLQPPWSFLQGRQS